MFRFVRDQCTIKSTAYFGNPCWIFVWTKLLILFSLELALQVFLCLFDPVDLCVFQLLDWEWTISSLYLCILLRWLCRFQNILIRMLLLLAFFSNLRTFCSRSLLLLLLQLLWSWLGTSGIRLQLSFGLQQLILVAIFLQVGTGTLTRAVIFGIIHWLKIHEIHHLQRCAHLGYISIGMDHNCSEFLLSWPPQRLESSGLNAVTMTLSVKKMAFSNVTRVSSWIVLINQYSL